MVQWFYQRNAYSELYPWHHLIPSNEGFAAVNPGRCRRSSREEFSVPCTSSSALPRNKDGVPWPTKPSRLLLITLMVLTLVSTSASRTPVASTFGPWIVKVSQDNTDRHGVSIVGIRRPWIILRGGVKGAAGTTGANIADPQGDEADVDAETASGTARFRGPLAQEASEAAETWRAGMASDVDTLVQEYVTTVQQRDARMRDLVHPNPLKNNHLQQLLSRREKGGDGALPSSSTSPSLTPSSSAREHDDDAPPVPASGDSGIDGGDVAVGVKTHRRSNAVGDPDDDDDDDEDDLNDLWEDLDEDDLATLIGLSATSDNSSFTSSSNFSHIESIVGAPHPPASTTTTEVQLNVDFVDGTTASTSNPAAASVNSLPMESTPKGGGGVGVGVRNPGRLPQRRKELASTASTQTATADKQDPAQVASKAARIAQTRLLDAWQPHVYLPPGEAALNYLTEQARQVDADSKTRLDRRTLYAGLLLEWSQADLTYRKYLDKSTSQALQAALSMATQPQWRRAFPTPNGVRLYDGDDSAAPTLAMQETMAMALAHHLGVGMAIIDDEVLVSVKSHLLSNGFAEDEVKTATILKSLFALGQQGHLRRTVSGSWSARMQKDLQAGLDDPFDERASTSCAEMSQWEEKWGETDPDNNNNNSVDKPLPLIVFIRTQSARALLQSKSAVEVLMQECNASSDSINLVVLGKGVDETTETVPKEPTKEIQDMFDTNGQSGAATWFGFSPHNQNASGENDPEGSRRFNIFLSRTVNTDGTTGILGAIAPPQAGNLFPHMMAMQAKDRFQDEDFDDLPIRAELEKWAQNFQQKVQSSGGMPFPPPQFFNATLPRDPDGTTESKDQNPTPEVIQVTLERAMGELLDRLAQMTEEGDTSNDFSPSMNKAFAQILRNENLRRGIAENLARAAPALSDPKCQGVMLSVYVPPPPAPTTNQSRVPGPASGWFQKILNSQDAEEKVDDESRRNSKQRRERTMAAAAAVIAASEAQPSGEPEGAEAKADRNLARLESVCRPIVVKTPSDRVRAKSWEAWVARERGAVIFRRNRRALNAQLESRSLALQEHTGTLGAGSSLRQMLSAKDISEEMESIVKSAIELEAANSQRQNQSPDEIHENEMDLDVDITIKQLMTVNGPTTETVQSSHNVAVKTSGKDMKYIHPSSLEAAITMIAKIGPSPAGALSLAPVPHRSREEILALAQDKHERALVSQVVSPHDIGVTYDMIGGLSDIKELLRQSITYPLKYPHLYSEGIAREAVKGVLLFGPPGTGKTMLAKAVATEGGASFLSVDASSIENKWLGESEKNAKAVFTLARRLAPCVIFIDEVDSLLSSREGSSDDSAHGTLTSVKTTMMSEWDGLNSGTNGVGEAGSDRVIVIGSTNRPYDLDEAVLRRFPRRIMVDLPDLQTRKEILEVTLVENRLDPNVNITKIAEKLEGYTGSDIKEVCREAVVQISHEQAKILDEGMQNKREDITKGSLQKLRPVTMDDFEKAMSKLTKSVSEKGRELARVWEWNDEYGEIKRKDKNRLPHLANLYL